MTGGKVEYKDLGLPSDIERTKSILLYKNNQFVSEIPYSEEVLAKYKNKGYKTEIKEYENKTATQQPILTLTPEIKAKIQGKAPELKQPSGVSPFGSLMPRLATQ